MSLPPAERENRAVPVGGPRHYPAKTCAERGWHRVRVYPLGDYKCEDCGEWGDKVWATSELRKQGEFLLTLGTAVEELARKQVREYGMLFDSDSGYPITTAHGEHK